MSIAVNLINERILEQLSRRELRLLSLVVAIRKDFGAMEGFKGDLTESVKSALRRLVTARVVVDVEGLYALAGPVEAPATVGRGSQAGRAHA